jgi:hypothetical protein
VISPQSRERCVECEVAGGGCTVASPFGGNVADGKNCRGILNVGDALCDNGACKILSCKSGFKISTSGDGCVDPLDNVQGAVVIDQALALLVPSQLLIPGFDIVAAKNRLLLVVQVFDYDHVFQALLLEGSIVKVQNLLELKHALGLDASVLRRDITDVDSLFALIVERGLFVRGFDLVAAKQMLIASLRVFDVSRALELLLGQNAFVGVYNLLALRDLLGLDFAILRRGVPY